MREKGNTMTLDCGHEPSPHGPHTTGTAHTADGREICWTCADNEQRADMATADTFDAYLNSDCSQVTTWTDGELAKVTQVRHSKGTTPTGGEYDRYYVQAVDPTGQLWTGRGPGPGMYLRLRRTR